MGIEDESITGGCKDALCGEDAFSLNPTLLTTYDKAHFVFPEKHR